MAYRIVSSNGLEEFDDAPTRAEYDALNGPVTVRTADGRVENYYAADGLTVEYSVDSAGRLAIPEFSELYSPSGWVSVTGPRASETHYRSGGRR